MRLGKTHKKTTPDKKLILERQMIGLAQMLVLDQNKCTGCRDCQIICPTEAISSSEAIIEHGSLKEPIRMDIDPDLCHFCGQCVIICPTKAISWRENQEGIPTLISNGTFPTLDEGIDIQIEKCRLDCQLVCVNTCPVEALTVKVYHDTDSDEDRISDIEVDRARCFYCHQCEKACPYDAIEIHSARQGIAIFLHENCPEGCHACTEVCPSGALCLENEQVTLDETICIFCRACQNVCPADKAIEIRREKIRHHPVSSRLWDEIVEKLVSNAAKARLLGETASNKRRRAFRTRID